MRTTSGRSSRAAAHPRGAVPRLADDLEVAGRLQHGAQAEPDQLLVVDQQHPDRSVTPAAPPRRRKPPSSRGSARSRPPRVRTRSPNPTRPKPPPGGAGTVASAGPLTTRTTSWSAGRSTVHATPRAGRVLAGVGQRLLHDPVRGAADGRVDRRGAVGGPAQRRRSSRPARHSSTSRAQVVEAGLRAERRVVVRRRRAARRPSGAARRAPAGRRSAPGTASCSTRPRSAAAISIAPACSTMRLTRWPTASCISRAIRVRSVSDGVPGQQLPLGLGALGPLGERGEQLGAGAHPGADRAGQHHDERGRRRAPPSALVERRAASTAGRRPRQPTTAAAIRTGQRPLVAADGVGGERDGDRHGRARRRRARRAASERDERGRAAEQEQRDAEQRGQPTSDDRDGRRARSSGVPAPTPTATVAEQRRRRLERDAARAEARPHARPDAPWPRA